MTDVSEILRLVKAQDQVLDKFDGRIKELQDEGMDLAKKITRAQFSGGNGQGAVGYTPELGAALRKALLGNDVELKGMSAGTDSEGGYLVVPQMDEAIRMIREQVSPVSMLAREIVLDQAGEILMPASRGTLATAWVSENASRPETDSLPFVLNRIELHEHYACPSVSQKLLDTAHYDIGALLVEQIAHGLGVSEATAIHTGDGAGKPRGFATYTTSSSGDSTRTWGDVQYIASGAAGAFATSAPADCLIETVGALQAQYRSNAAWLMNRSTAAALYKLKDSTGRPLVVESLQIGQPAALLGYPIVVDDSLPDIAANSLSIWFGDWREAYAIARQPGVKLLRDPYSTKGQVAFYAYSRVGGAMVNSEAVKTVKFAAS